MARILVTEEIAEGGLDRLRLAGHEVDVQLGLSREQFLATLPGANALIIRSATDVDAKALAVATRYDNAIIIGSDQVVCCGEDLLGKPGNHENAVSQLKRLSGREALFFTALCVHHTGTSRTLQHLACNPVKFRLLTAEVIERYLKKEQPYDCAGSAKSEGLGITLVEKIGGEDPNALIGLPLIALVGLLGEQGVRLP